MHYRDKLPHIQKQYNLLTQLEQHFKSQLGLTPCVGAELEFYIHGTADIILLEDNIGHKVKTEKGQNQYEIDIWPSQDLAAYAKYIDKLRRQIIHFAGQMGEKQISVQSHLPMIMAVPCIFT